MTVARAMVQIEVTGRDARAGLDLLDDVLDGGALQDALTERIRDEDLRATIASVVEIVPPAPRKQKRPKGGPVVLVPCVEGETIHGVRRPLRAIAFVAARAPTLAPRGWVEIQADDTPSDGGPRISNELAGVLVCQAARRPGMAWQWSDTAGVGSPLLIVSGEAVPTIDADVASDLDLHTSAAPPSWIVIVPADVAKAAGLRGSR